MITKPKGTNDLYAIDAKNKQYVDDVLKSICEKFNYQYIETPIFEASELFHRGAFETTDLVSKETYDFVDRGGREVTLRPEGTASICRWFIENKLYGNMSEPVKVFYNGKMFRYERPQSGRYREFTQFGAEFIGSSDVLADADNISLAYNTYNLLGLKNVTILLNTLGDKESRENYRKALIDHLTPQIDKLCDDCKNRLIKNPLRILDCKIDANSDIITSAPKTIDYLNEESLLRYNKLKEYLDLMEINYREDANLVRGLDYYTHTVYEIVADVPELGNIALGGGGRYDGLIELLGGPNTPAVGFAMGLDRTILAVQLSGGKIPVNDAVDIYVMHVSESETETAAYLTQDLRMNGFITETAYLNKSLKAEFKSADRLKAKFLIILNDEDIQNGLVNVKDNLTKEEEKVKITDLIDYLDMHM